MKTPPAPDWDSLPPLISSVEVARMFQILPKTLSKYAQRGTIARPVETGTNHALYRKEDVRALWAVREVRKAQGYIKAGDEPPTGPPSPADPPGTELGDASPAVPPALLDGMRDALAAAVAEGVSRGNEGLREEIAALRAELAELRAQAQETPPTQPPTFWARLFTKRP